MSNTTREICDDHGGYWAGADKYCPKCQRLNHHRVGSTVMQMQLAINKLFEHGTYSPEEQEEIRKHCAASILR